MRPSYQPKLYITRNEYDLLREYIRKLSGISLGAEKAYLVENRLGDLVCESGCKSFGDFYFKLKHAPGASFLRKKMIDLISTNETFWFRDKHPFDTLETIVFPALFDRVKAGPKDGIRIWCAACSTGQEPYSIAMKAIDYYKKNIGNASNDSPVSILATDISHTAVCKAREGLYDATAMNRGLDNYHKDTYFKAKDRQWAVSDDVRNLVSFQTHNLKEPIPCDFGPFDVIFLRYVVIYFSDELKKSIYEKMALLLKPDGFLFMGNGEIVTGHCRSFRKVPDSHYPFYQLDRNECSKRVV